MTARGDLNKPASECKCKSEWPTGRWVTSRTLQAARTRTRAHYRRHGYSLGIQKKAATYEYVL